MDKQQFWHLIEEARSKASDPDDCAEVARRTASTLAGQPPEEIAAAQQVLWDLMADSYRNPLWAAAYVINGGCSDDGFDYFRGWLITQGRQVFEQVVADPDALAELPVVRAAADAGFEFECEEALAIAWDAHIMATGEELPGDVFTIRYPELEPAWDFDFDDRDETTRCLPRLAALHLDLGLEQTDTGADRG